MRLLSRTLSAGDTSRRSILVDGICQLYDDCSARIHGGDNMGTVASRVWEDVGRIGDREAQKRQRLLHG